ncbi:hypothetical protein [Bradyrhizobium sp.]|uniref:hypothetical protein n=1 Tax=Bradyrhizobium sp. TaxID=376 RepID=UPI0007C926D5|nr:hypothetical protein [Bradyrhizobium sp.]
MHIQHCVKGIAGESGPGANDGITWAQAVSMVSSGDGIYSNWWRNKGTITPAEIKTMLTADNLDRHLHDYDTFGPDTPYISLAAGAVIRDPAFMTNQVYDAVDTALFFATNNWERAGALFFCWTVVGFHPAVPFEFVSEPVRDLLIYRGWSPYHHEGEIAAKVHISAHQVRRIEWWDPALDQFAPTNAWDNPGYQKPNPLLNERDLINDLDIV